MDGQSLDITSNLLHKLKELVPGAFSEDKLDSEKLKTLIGQGRQDQDVSALGVKMTSRLQMLKYLFIESNKTIYYGKGRIKATSIYEA